MDKKTNHRNKQKVPHPTKGPRPRTDDPVAASNPAEPYREHPLEEASMDLLMARSNVDVLHDIWAMGDDALKESIAEGAALSGMLYDILCRIRRAEELIGKLPRTHTVQS